VIADLGMPKLDGWALCRALRADEATRDVPVLILTARESEPEGGQVERLGIRRFFTKPFSPREILATVQEIERARAVSAAPASGTRPA
jgi:DNA-binding response OmpR family regulator